MTAFTLNPNRCDEDNIHQPSPLTNQPLIFSLYPSTYSTSKRCIDIIGALIGLLILEIIFLPIAIAIKLDSPGNIFYS